MTRDEAIRIANRFWGTAGSADGVDMLVALGVLKLEEPVSANERFISACVEKPQRDLNPNAALSLLHSLGLKIVEK